MLKINFTKNYLKEFPHFFIVLPEGDLMLKNKKNKNIQILLLKIPIKDTVRRRDFA
jgi:hypothetical protein